MVSEDSDRDTANLESEEEDSVRRVLRSLRPTRSFRGVRVFVGFAPDSDGGDLSSAVFVFGRVVLSSERPGLSVRGVLDFLRPFCCGWS